MPYRETIVNAAEMAPPKDKTLPRGTVISVTASKQITIRLRVRPLPLAVTEFLERNVGAVQRLYSERRAEEESNREGLDDSAFLSRDDADHAPTADGTLLSLLEFRESLQAVFAHEKRQADIWADVVEKIAAFGPRRTGPNLLIDVTEHGTCQRL